MSDPHDPHDPHDLARFLAAQHDTYQRAVTELRAGRKTGHWMWFVFPQIAGLGHSAMSQRYAIVSLDEARAYLHHPVLGPRLAECAAILIALGATDAEQIFGAIDAVKLRSSITLFARASDASDASDASEDDSVYDTVLDQYFGGVPDPHTDARL
ncbi:MAG TPA: DUF1810 domain-containing protein [Solirubrobacteraceae bacterium]